MFNSKSFPLCLAKSNLRLTSRASYVNRVIFRTFYGLKIAEENDPYIHLAKRAMDGFIECSVPGTFLVDMIPALKYVPDWMPGTGWKKLAKYFKDISYRSKKDPWDNVLEKMVSIAIRLEIGGSLLNLWLQSQGVAEPSVASRIIEGLSPIDSPNRQQEEEDARDAAGVGYVGMMLQLPADYSSLTRYS